MPDNGIHVIWKSCYKQLSLSYQSSGRGGGSPLGAWRCPPAAAVPRAPPFFGCRSWWRRALDPPRRVACVRRVAARASAGCRRPCRLASRAWFCWGGGARSARDCARCGARCTAGTWLTVTASCDAVTVKPLHMVQHSKGIIFFGDMCGEENTSRPANVRAVRRRRTARALQSGRKPLCQKVILFDRVSKPPR